MLSAFVNHLAISCNAASFVWLWWVAVKTCQDHLKTPDRFWIFPESWIPLLATSHSQGSTIFSTTLEWRWCERPVPWAKAATPVGLKSDSCNKKTLQLMLSSCCSMLESSLPPFILFYPILSVRTKTLRDSRQVGWRKPEWLFGMPVIDTRGTIR